MSHLLKHSFTNPPWQYDIGYGRVPGASLHLLIGQRDQQQIASGSITIWDAAENEGDNGNIVFLDSNSNIWISSTSTLDTNVAILIQGLDEEFNQQQEVVVTNGQTPVQLSQPYRFIQTAINVGGNVNVGNIYISATAAHTLGVPNDVTKIQSKILPTLGVTHNGFFIVPKGKAAAAIAIRGNTDTSTKPSEISTWARLQDDGVFFQLVKYSISPSFAQFIFPVPIGTTEFVGINSTAQGEGSIVEYKSEAVSNNTNVLFAVDFVVSDVRDYNI